ncbi:hypothetical protein HPP92_027317 [Vanilla planifolia]|uniref:Uncharacterized protein n=1 Tax=Vanilla planifolia TaxID=51239 RepID=A0A835U4N7_VANPL|nr:hypothetical protein HPP92_027317 [Vanilla planifolia]
MEGTATGKKSKAESSVCSLCFDSSSSIANAVLNGNPITTSASEEVRSSGVFTDQIKGNGSRLLHVSVPVWIGGLHIYTEANRWQIGVPL